MHEAYRMINGFCDFSLEISAFVFLKNLQGGKCNGYTNSAGLPEARRALAREYSMPDKPLREEVGSY